MSIKLKPQNFTFVKTIIALIVAKASLLAIMLSIYIIMFPFIEIAHADTKFHSSYPCTDGRKVCVSSGTRTIDGYQVHRDCWEWGYSKTCSYPSKNDCSSYVHCYDLGIVRCILFDSISNCVNQYKEFSCKRWVPAEAKESQKVRTDLKAKDGPEGLVCKGIPCLDGSCVDKSYQTNGEMMDSISKLYAVSEAKGAKDINATKLFEGFAQHCTKKAAQYSNCCSSSLKGWSSNLGARCTRDEQQLNDMRSKNLCVYVGKQNKGYMKTTVKHHYCCFGNMLNKVIQVQGRKQLGLSFGSGGRPDCRGLTLAEIMRINWERVDFGEFIEELKLKFLGNAKIPSQKDMESRIKSSMPKMNEYDGNQNNKANNAAGWNSSKVKDDSFEADQEREYEQRRK